MSTHELKIWPAPFKAVLFGDKQFEWRVNDRNYQVGDHLLLREWDPKTEQYTGWSTTVVVTYILREGFGLPEGVVVMSIKLTPVPGEWVVLMPEGTHVFVSDEGKILAQVQPDSSFGMVHGTEPIHEVIVRGSWIGRYMTSEQGKLAAEEELKRSPSRSDQLF